MQMKRLPEPGKPEEPTGYGYIDGHTGSRSHAQRQTRRSIQVPLEPVRYLIVDLYFLNTFRPLDPI